MPEAVGSLRGLAAILRGAEGNGHVTVGKENYFLSGDGLLMPAHKDQPPPDLHYFKRKGDAASATR